MEKHKLDKEQQPVTEEAMAAPAVAADAATPAAVAARVVAAARQHVPARQLQPGWEAASETESTATPPKD